MFTTYHWARAYALPLILGSLLLSQHRLMAQEDLSVTLSSQGLTEVVHFGDELLGTGGKAQTPKLLYYNVRTAGQEAAGERVQISGRETVTFNPENKTFVGEYGQVRLSVRYKQQGNDLKLQIELTNTMEENWIGGWGLRLLQFRNLEPARKWPRLLRNRPFGAVDFVEEKRSMALYFPEHKKHLLDMKDGLLTLQANPFQEIATVEVDPALYEQLGADPIKPGETRTLSLTLRFGESGLSVWDLFADEVKAYGQQNPMVLEWEDRRPLGVDFIASHGQFGEGNPRGWFNDRNLNVFTQEGREEFKQKLFERVKTNLKNLRRINAQGIIIWDIEGQEFYHPISYMGDPRMLAETTPEMDEIADEMFKRYRDAGYRVGITIRPSSIHENNVSSNGKRYTAETGREAFHHIGVKNPIENMIDKITYAKNRWGATLFYLDSNVRGLGTQREIEKNTHNGLPHVMPGHWLKAVQEAHPDVLVIPEWNEPEAAPYTAVYCSGIIKQRANPNRRLYPQSFAVLAVNDVDKNYEEYLQSALAGDILLASTFYQAPILYHVETIQTEVDFIRKGMPSSVASASSKTIAPLLSDPDPYLRYHATMALGKMTDPTSAAQLRSMGMDTNTVVQKKAYQTLGAHPSAIDSATLEQVRGFFLDRPQDHAALLITLSDLFVAAGEQSVPYLTELIALRKTPYHYPYPNLLKAAGELGIYDEGLARAIRSILEEDHHKFHRSKQPAIEALAAIDDQEAIPLIRRYAYSTPRDPYLAMVVVAALADLGDSESVEFIVKSRLRGGLGVVVYWIESHIKNNLAKLLRRWEEDPIGWYLSLAPEEKVQYQWQESPYIETDPSWLPQPGEVLLSASATLLVNKHKLYRENFYKLFKDDFFGPGSISGEAFVSDASDPSATIDLGSVQTVSRIRVANNDAMFNRSRPRKTIEFLGSRDGQTWEMIWSEKEYPDYTGRLGWDLPVDNKEYRHIKIQQPGAETFSLERAHIFGPLPLIDESGLNEDLSDGNET